MITNQFRQALAAHLFYHRETGASTGLLLKDINGTTFTLHHITSNPYGTLNGVIGAFIGQYTENDSAPGVFFGDGSAPPTAGDYKLSGTKITGLTCSVVVSGSYTEAAVEKTATFNIVNGNSADVTIREVGLKVALNYNSSGYHKEVLADRTVLDNPLPIPAGGVGQLVYTIRMEA